MQICVMGFGPATAKAVRTKSALLEYLRLFALTLYSGCLVASSIGVGLRTISYIIIQSGASHAMAPYSHNSNVLEQRKEEFYLIRLGRDDSVLQVVRDGRVPGARLPDDEVGNSPATVQGIRLSPDRSHLRLRERFPLKTT